MRKVYLGLPGFCHLQWWKSWSIVESSQSWPLQVLLKCSSDMLWSGICSGNYNILYIYSHQAALVLTSNTSATPHGTRAPARPATSYLPACPSPDQASVPAPGLRCPTAQEPRVPHFSILPADKLPDRLGYKGSRDPSSLFIFLSPTSLNVWDFFPNPLIFYALFPTSLILEIPPP